MSCAHRFLLVALNLFGLLPDFPSAHEMTQGFRKSRSSPLKHIFSTILAFRPPSTQNWVSNSLVAQEWLSKKFKFALRAPFPTATPHYRSTE